MPLMDLMVDPRPLRLVDSSVQVWRMVDELYWKSGILIPKYPTRWRVQD